MKNQLPVCISYSGGTSSRWVIEAMIRGVIPRPQHVAVFSAQTGEEHSWTYVDMNEVEVVCRNAGLLFTKCYHPKHSSLGNHILEAVSSGATRMDNPPFYIDKGGSRGQIGQRCSREFKTYPIRRAVSKWLKSIRMPKRVEAWIGFAADELNRAQKALAKRDVQWETLDFPGIRYGRTRAMQRAELTAWIGHAPKFSMCTFCPHKTPERWAATEGKDLERAIEVDENIRNLDEFGLTDGPAYLSDRLVPISKLPRYNASSDDLRGTDGCEGGRCFL